MKIIGISGRKGSGKSAVSAQLSESGYQRISFADFLKETCSALSGLTLESMYDVTSKEEPFEVPFIWDEKVCSRLSEIAEIKIPFEGERLLWSRREMFQFIGTDVLRNLDPDIHIKKTKERLLTVEKCYVDDVRFPNEKYLIEEMGGITVYIVRPNNYPYSNHPSETSLHWTDFDHVIVNDRSEETLKRRFKLFLETVERKGSLKRPDRAMLANLLRDKSTSEIAESWGCSRDKVVWWANAYLLRIPRNNYSINSRSFSFITPETAYWAGVMSADGCIKKSGRSRTCMVAELTGIDFPLIDGFRKFVGSDKSLYKRRNENSKMVYSCVVNDPFIVDDLKLWDVFPRKSKINKVPEIIKMDDSLISQWVVGLIDGDGSIFEINRGTSVIISILASSEVVNFIESWSNTPCSKNQEKDIDNLFSLKFSGKNAVSLYKKIYRNKGLDRKWDKIKPFIDKNWHH